LRSRLGGQMGETSTEETEMAETMEDGGMMEENSMAEVNKVRARGLGAWKESNCWTAPPERQCKRCDWCLANLSVISTSERRERSRVKLHSVGVEEAGIWRPGKKGRKKKAAAAGKAPALGVKRPRGRPAGGKAMEAIGKSGKGGKAKGKVENASPGKAKTRELPVLTAPYASPSFRFWELPPKPAPPKPKAEPKAKAKPEAKPKAGPKRVKGEDMYIVKALVARKRSKATGEAKYLVEWEGYPDQLTWETAEAFNMGDSFNELYTEFLDAHGEEGEVVYPGISAKYARYLDNVV